MPDLDLFLLLQRCLSNNLRDDWGSLISAIEPTVAAAVFRALSQFGPGGSVLAKDLIQDVFLKLCDNNLAVLRACRATSTGAVHVYLQAVPTSTVIDHFRTELSQRKGSGKAAENLDDLAPVLPSRESVADTVERKLLLAKVDDCLAGQQDRNRLTFWLYHRQGFTPKAIAALRGIGIEADGVETLLYRLTKAVRDCLRRTGVLNRVHSREGGRA